MDLKEETQDNLMSRDLLEKSSCCRFCAIGGNSRPENVSFIQIFEESDMLNLNERLDNLINRYLPLKVSEDDLYYPRFVCSTCFYSLEETIQFFEKISAGQKILMKIINQNKMPEPRPKKEVDQSFSENNPLLQPPKRRGRPRRDPNKPKETKPAGPEAWVSKPKRQTKPPVRYTSDFESSGFRDSVDIKEEPAEERTEDQEQSSATQSPHDFLSFQTSVLVVPPSHASLPLEEVLQNQKDYQLSVVGSNSVIDLNKFNIILAGDETDGMQLQVQSSAASEQVSELDQATSRAFVVQSGTYISEISSTLNVAATGGEVAEIGQIEVPQHEGTVVPEIEKDADSDDSVKTIDLIQHVYTKKRRRKMKRKKQSSITFKCPDPGCEKHFRHRSSLVYHRSAVHESAPKKHACHICGRSFSQKTLLNAHIFTHSDEKHFNCNECTLKFKSKSSLYTHKKSVHGERNPFTCEQCGVQFNLKSSLNAHLRLHSGIKPYSCEFCDKKFAQASNMKEHRRVHTGERPYKCSHKACDKAFTTSSQLRSHRLIHSGLKPYLCSICGKGFIHGENFKYHQRRHTGERPLGCPLCPKHFVEPHSLKKHWRLHTGERPYTCPFCKKDFSDPSNFAKHKKLHDGEELLDTVTTDPIHPPKNIVVSQVGETEPQDNAAPKDASLAERLIAAGVHVIDTNDSSTAFTSDGSLVRVLNAEGIETLESVDGTQQYIYVYPEDMPIFTITLGDNQQAIEVRASDEGTLQALGNLAGGPISFATVESGDGQYFNLEAFDGSASFVSIPKTDMNRRNIASLSMHLPTEEVEPAENLVSTDENPEELDTTLVTVLHMDESQGTSQSEVSDVKPS